MWDQILDEIEHASVPSLRAGLEQLSRKWPDFYWTLQVRGNDAITNWIVSGFKYACPIDDDEVSASLTAQVRDGNPHISADVWIGSTLVGQSQELSPKDASELHPFLEQSIQVMLSELDLASERLLKMIDGARDE